MKKTIIKDEKSKIEKRYYLSSIKDIIIVSEAIIKHWSVENKLHWQLDFTFKCDNNRTKNKKALLNLQLIKKTALKVLNVCKEDYKKSLVKIRKIISRNSEKELNKIFKILYKKQPNF